MQTTFIQYTEVFMPIPKQVSFEAPKSAKIRIYEALREWIIDGTLQPGEKILDSEISQYFSVSRTPVREAIQMLAEQKLIEIHPGKESRISELDVIDIPQTYKMLAEIHATAVEFAFAKFNYEEIQNLKDANRRFEQAFTKRNIKGCRTCDKEFHEIIIRLADNDFLTAFCETLSGHASRVENIYFSTVGDMDELIHEHNAIVEAIENKDLEKAKEFMRSNWLHTPEVLGIQ